MTKLEKIPEWLVRKLTSANRNSQPTNFMSVGSRNNDLTSYAGFLVRKGVKDEEDLAHLLLKQNSTSADPLPEGEVRGIAKSVVRYRKTGLPDYDDLPVSRELAAYLATDTRNTGTLGWMSFIEKVWVQDTVAGLVQEKAKKFSETVCEGVRSDPHRDGDALKQARQLLSSSKIGKAIALACSDDCLRCEASDFDADPRLLNMQNGTLNLEAGELQDHDPTDLITKITNAHHDPDATCPNFDNLLGTCLPEEHRRFVLRLFGYSLLGDPEEQVFVLFHGPGANGKSTLVNAVTAAIGDYAANAEPSTFIRQKNPGIRNDLARLKGVRMLATSELATGEILDAPLVKRLTGGDPITARFLHKELFEYKPQFVMFMTTNALPVINGADAAMGRRIVLVPFNTVIPKEGQDASLPTKLRLEASGIINRVLEGLKDYKENGLAVPADLVAEAEAYTKTSDMIRSFLDDVCEITTEGVVRASYLYLAYKMWCGGNGLKPLSQPQFRAELIKKTGINPDRRKEGFVWPGLSVRRPTM